MSASSETLRMFTAETRDEDAVTHYQLLQSGAALTWTLFIDALRNDRDFRRWFAQLLAESRHAAYFFETPPLTAAKLTDPVEFVLVDSPALTRIQQSERAFETHFDAGLVVTFENLGKDAVLVVPCPGGAENSAHLAAFLRTGHDAAVDALWQMVGEAIRARLSDVPVWVSTSGLGVHWLHVRLDSRPKYYQHAPFRQA